MPPVNSAPSPPYEIHNRSQPVDFVTTQSPANSALVDTSMAENHSVSMMRGVVLDDVAIGFAGWVLVGLVVRG